MKKKSIILGTTITLFIASILVVVFMNPFKQDQWEVNANNLQYSFQIISGDGEIDDLSKWTNFEWDTIYSFKPYTSKEEIYKVIGYNWDEIDETVNEGMNQIVFLNKGEVVCYLYGYPENLGIGFDFGDYEGSHIKLSSEKPLRFKTTVLANEKVRYFKYIK